MERKKVAIFSSNSKLFRFFEIEALSLGFEVRKYDDFIELENDLDLAVVDADTISMFPEVFYCPVCIVSIKNKSENFKSDYKHSNRYLLSWPTPINIFGQILKNIYLFSEIPQAEINEEIDDIIYYSFENSGTVIFKNKKILLSELEQKLLFALCQAGGEAIDREALNKIFDVTDGNIVDVYIHHLRKKLEEPFSRKIIYTVRSKGYKTTAKLKRI